MPRRKADSAIFDDNDSQKENMPAVKREKLNGKQDNASRPAQKPPVDEDADDDDQEEEEDQPDAEGSPKGPKRSRLNMAGDSTQQAGTERVKTQPRDKDGFIPGSIVRIQLRNFVTYDFVEFRPGPHLNMIIGPNGTGKSSIACAICLGLNWPPSILGRANEINQFVKSGCADGHIEIELKGPARQPNLVIRRNLVAKDKTSTFSLNQKSSTGKEISDRMKELNVQVGNLCSFLPQDKVSGFAAMTPQQLLKETQRAAGDKELSSWHQTLIDEGKELKTLEELIQGEIAQLNQMRERNETIEREVQRVREKQDIERRIALLEILLAIQIYREKRDEYVECKRIQRRCHEKVVALKERNKAAEDLQKTLAAQSKSLEAKRDNLKKTTVALFGKMSKVSSKAEEMEDQTEDINKRIERLDLDEKDRSHKIRNCEAQLKQLKEQLSEEDAVQDKAAHAALNEEAKQINLERRPLMARQTDLSAEISSRVDMLSRLESQHRRIEQQLIDLNSVDNQKLDHLARFDQDTHDVLLWLRKNQDKFKEPIIEPPVMTVTVQDARYTRAVEGCLSFNQLKSFIAQNHDDYNTFNRLVQDGNAIGRNVRVTAWHRDKLSHLYVEPPILPNDLRSMGFDGYALDFITFPDGMRWFLQADVQLHRTAIALRAESVAVQDAMEAVGRSGGASFITGNTMHQVSRSRYGQRQVQNITRELRQPQVLQGLKVDENAKNRLLGEKRDKEVQIEAMRDEQAQISKQLDAVHEEDKTFQHRANDVSERKKAIQDRQKQRVSKQGLATRLESQLKHLKAQGSVEQERKKLRQRLVEVSLQRAKHVKQYAGLARAVVEEQRECTRIALQYLQSCANQTALAALVDQKNQKLNQALIEFQAADKAFEKAKEESSTHLEHSREMVSNAREDIKEQYSVMHRARTDYDNQVKAGQNPSGDGIDLRNSDQLEGELEERKAALAANLDTNPGVVEEYEQRKRNIEILQKTVDDRQTKAARIKKRIKDARDNWQPALERLVESIGTRFSAAFDRIGCAGEIRISEHDDYDKWAIDILVKFRDNEKLQLLTGQRQSGGERSLTTILYLMALTEEARAPFSLVDEINQGMDQRAERVVHNSMVEVTCKEDSAQYFLITPKLLADLDYHERMKILCVNNGEWLPEERSIGNLKGLLDTYIAHRRGT